LINTIHYIAIINAIVIGFVLLFLKRNEKHDSKYLGLFLLFLALAITNESYGDYFKVEFSFLYPFKFFLLLPNLIYLHINSKIKGSNFRKNTLVNFIPGVVEFVTLFVLLILFKTNVIDKEGDFLYFFDEVYNYLTIAYTVFIQIIILKKIKFYNKNLYAYKSTVGYKYLNWLKSVCAIIILNEIYYTLFYIFSEDLNSDTQSYIIYAVIELGLIFYIGVGALLQANLKIEIPIDDLENIESNNIDIINQSSVNETNSLFAEIEEFMKSARPFLNPDLNLRLLSKNMNIPERKLSTAINQSTEQNFYSYINKYRVEAVKIMLTNNDQEKYSIVGIGEAAGFNSKSSFYTNFKKVTGISPSLYIKELS